MLLLPNKRCRRSAALDSDSFLTISINP
jgi:hypothetical protein